MTEGLASTTIDQAAAGASNTEDKTSDSHQARPALARAEAIRYKAELVVAIEATLLAEEKLILGFGHREDVSYDPKTEEPVRRVLACLHPDAHQDRVSANKAPQPSTSADGPSNSHKSSG